jgi:hypothetical protein
MAIASATTNPIRLPSAAPAKVKQPSWAVRTRLARDLPQIRPALKRPEPERYRDTQQSTPLAMIMAIYSALPTDVRGKAKAFAQLLDIGAASDFTADCLQIMRSCDATVDCAAALSNARAEQAR